MTDTRSVAVLVGSLREDSNNRKLARALIGLAPDGAAFEFVDIGQLPLYNPDLEDDDPPAEWQDFRDQIRSRDAVLFVTPEYNRSMPGALKNAIDVGSRPKADHVWNGKPAAIVTGSAGVIGGFGANHHLRQSLVPLNMPTMPFPEAYIGRINDMFDESGAIVKDDTRDFLRKVMKAFAAWVERHRLP